MTITDHELMRRAAENDARAFGLLAERWEARTAAVLRRLAPAADVEDLRQEVFLRVWRAAGRYRPRAVFSTWLFRIVINVARDAARRRRLWVPLTADAVVGGDSPRERCEQREIRLLVAESLASLPDAQREILVLKHYADLTFAQAADVLGLPVSTVKSRLATGLLQLRAELARRGIQPEETKT